MRRWPKAQRRSRLSSGATRTALTLLLAVITLLLAACSLPSSAPTPAPGAPTPAPVAQPERCRNDGAVQTWLLLPLDPPDSELMAAYQERQVIEFQATVSGQDDSPALQPHRRFILQEAAEGVTLLLDYQGDPPPLVPGQSYRFIAWADLAPPASEPITVTQEPPAGPALPDSRGYELQIYDSAGLLFVGLTDVDVQDDPLDLRLESLAGECVPAPAPRAPCVASRQVLPLRVQWGEEEISLYPGEDGQVRHEGAAYLVSLFRNRQVIYAEPPCTGYREHLRSLRIDRSDPPPVIAPPPPITSTTPLTATTPLAETPIAPTP